MIKRLFSLLAIIFFSFVLTGIALAWGTWGHKHIDRAAVFALPAGMAAFYFNHIDYITETAVVPDLRHPLLNDFQESPRHFIDIEDFKIPLSEFPRTMKEAEKQFDKKMLSKSGILPWYIEDMMQKLTNAFEKKNKSEILFLSSELAHYVGDSHMPLHTSSNYNGQLTGQTGIHSLWESVIPSRFGESFNLRVDQARYISDITGYTWKMIAQSHALVDSVLNSDRLVRQQFDSTNMYLRDEHGNLILRYNNPLYSDTYVAAFQKQMGNLVEDQLRLSIYDVACYWYTAWVNAGKPGLDDLDDPALTKRNKKEFRKELKAWNEGKVLYIKY